MANKGNSDETEELSDAMQQGTDSRSNQGPDIKMKSESTSESEEKQDEKTTETHSSSPTESHPHSGAQPKTEDSKTEGIKEEKTRETHSSSPTESQPHSGAQPKTEEGREKGSKTEGIKEGPSGDYLPDYLPPKEKDEETAGDLNDEYVERDENEVQDQDQNLRPQNIVPGNNKKTRETRSSSPTESQPHSGAQPKTEEGREKGSKTEGIKEGPSGDYLPDYLPPKEKDEKMTQISSRPQNKSQPHFDTQTKTEEDREEGSKPEGKKEEETAGDLNDEYVERDENEVQDQDQNLRPQNIVPGNNKILWICAVGVILLAMVYAFMHSPDTTQPKPNEFNVVEAFNQEMIKLNTSFPKQHKELWRRSHIHLRRHLKTKNPSEPVSLILTSGHRAEKTLGCLARCLARAFSTALNSSVLNINGKGKASQDSDQVKLDIDRELRNAFEGEKSAAVIHHFEELPPGSTLIFYRYCDHENAAYKNVFLAFTVMLDAELELSSNVSLRRVEEMVQEHIKHKFVSSDKSAMFNQMDVDKLSGLWSRISHLILPVAAEEKIEQQGCRICD